MKPTLKNGAVLTADAEDVGKMWPNLNGTITAHVSNAYGSDTIQGIIKVEI